MKTRKTWYRLTLNLDLDDVSKLDEAIKRTGLREQDVIRQAMRLGMPLLEDKPAI